MADGNGDYLSRFERLERNLDRVVSVLDTVVEMQRQQLQMIERQSQVPERHSSRLDRAEILMAEMTEKANFLIDREMKREGGPESRA